MQNRILLILLAILLQGSYQRVVIKPQGKAFKGAECPKAYEAALDRLNREDYVTIDNTRADDLTRTYGSQTPATRAYGITFAIKQQDRKNITKPYNLMGSSAILMEVSNLIIGNCQNVGTVTIGYVGSSRTFGVLGPKEEVKEFECLSSVRNGRFDNELPWEWGLQWCQ
ncbi:hypothetical protein [Acaryochloris marina]|uniref:hypothetical protein n=1 Tax=Acaryochloris marina TaxID=155978 RepID=UPI001BB01011|nr:hypothetical protein [Acaryochloris marina]QUY45448.1 hypothetical protein I1H34_27100 [Acaryochloris marina S15]